MEIDFTEAASALPPLIWRNKWDSFAEKLGLPFKARTLANLDCKNEGPPRVCFGKRVGYPREGLITWLNNRAKGK